MNLNCYDYYPKEERKHIQDFIDDVDFMTSELRNLCKLKSFRFEEMPYDMKEDSEERHLADLWAVIDQSEELAHLLRVYKDGI